MHNDSTTPKNFRLTGIGAKLIRVSDDKQDRRRQHAAIDKWCSDKDATPVHSFEDAGSRDKYEDRQDFQSLLGLIRKKAIQWVVIAEFDRFGFADAFELGGFLDTFRKNGCLLVDLEGTVWTSLDPRNVVNVFFKGMSSPEAQMDTSKRIVSQRIGAAQRGEYAGGILPYGYDAVCYRGDVLKWRYVLLTAIRRDIGLRGKKGKTKGGFDFNGEAHFPDGRSENVDKMPPHELRKEILFLRPSILTYRLDTIRRLFLLMDSEAHNPNALATLFNKEGVPHYGPRWTDSIIRQLLQNPVHIGKPANGKRTHARFTQMVDGIVTKVDAESEKRGVHQVVAKSNWVMPEKPLFEPVVDPERFKRVQEKLEPKKKLRPVRSDELWLSGLVYCARCGQPMYGQFMRKNVGANPDRFFASYLCSHRRALGPDNPSGCRFHRIHHDVLEQMLSRFLKERGQTIDELLSTDRDRGALERLLRERAEHDVEMRSILTRMKSYVGDNLGEALATGLDNGDGVVCPETLRVIRSDGIPDADHSDSMNIVDLFDLISEHRSKTLKAEIVQLESEHEEMVERISLMTAKLAVEKLNAKLLRIEDKIASMRAQAEPLSDRWETIQFGLRELRERIGEAEVALAVGTGRMKAQAIRGAIQRVEVSFIPRGRTFSQAVELRILPRTGEAHRYGKKDLEACITNQHKPSLTKKP
jgi:DNA invertase Pin-like site-specific DNA recombinase